jgi:hypothetical protein
MKYIFAVLSILSVSLLAGCRTPVDMKRADINFSKKYSSEAEKKQVNESFDRVLSIAKEVCMSNQGATIVEWKAMSHQDWADEYDVTRAVRNYEVHTRGSNETNIPSRGFVEGIDETQQHKGFTCVVPNFSVGAGVKNKIMNEVVNVGPEYGGGSNRMEMNIGVVSVVSDNGKILSKLFHYTTTHIDSNDTIEQIRASILRVNAYDEYEGYKYRQKWAQTVHAQPSKPQGAACPAPTEEQIQRMKDSIAGIGNACRQTGARRVEYGNLTATCIFNVNVATYYYTRSADCAFIYMEDGKFSGLREIPAKSFR